jgi:hypothetical protein
MTARRSRSGGAGKAAQRPSRCGGRAPLVLEHSVRRRIDPDPDSLLLAKIGGEVVGVVRSPDWDGWRCRLYRLAVAHDRRRARHCDAPATCRRAGRLERRWSSRSDALAPGEERAERHKCGPPRGCSWRTRCRVAMLHVKHHGARCLEPVAWASTRKKVVALPRRFASWTRCVARVRVVARGACTATACPAWPRAHRRFPGMSATDLHRAVRIRCSGSRVRGSLIARCWKPVEPLPRWVGVPIGVDRLTVVLATHRHAAAMRWDVLCVNVARETAASP